jgi:hypothetical protein
MREMYLKVSTDKVGSTCAVGLGINEDEWEQLSEEEQDELVQDNLCNVADVWVEAV